jgi:hypothetical protein
MARASLRPIQEVLRGPPGPLAARLINRRGFERGFAKLFSVRHPLSADEAEAEWALLSHNDGHRIAADQRYPRRRVSPCLSESDLAITIPDEHRSAGGVRGCDHHTRAEIEKAWRAS